MGDGRTFTANTIDKDKAFTMYMDLDPNISASQTPNIHSKVPTDPPPPSGNQPFSDFTQIANSAGLSIGLWNICGWSFDPDQKLRTNAMNACDIDIQWKLE